MDYLHLLAGVFFLQNVDPVCYGLSDATKEVEVFEKLFFTLFLVSVDVKI